ncbi:MAG: hypothetical protein HY864_03015 [Chloroflexi bacterium]|nr:hypothetical protein [Chloroflexota bacterium]
MKNSSLKYIWIGVFASAALTAIIGITAINLTRFEIVGHTVPFAYPYRLVERSDLARLTAWLGYILHNLLAWGIIWFARREKPKYANDLRWFNWAMIAVNVAFSLLHIVQTQLFYDGLAQDVPEVTALGSVALMLIFIIILEAPRRGLIFGKKFKFRQAFTEIIRHYHGYFFTWAIIYDYWYHPTTNTAGHLMGFYYNFLIIVQAVLLFNRAHLNKWWTFFLEVFVLIHGVAVAIFQGRDMWPMFAFGFGAMIVLTQMHGLGLSTWTKRIIAAIFLVVTVGTCAYMGRLGAWNEVIRIPFIDYFTIFLLYGIFLIVNWVINLFKPRPQAVQTSTDS